jgi:peptide/nickel transport system substrate-binding protein
MLDDAGLFKQYPMGTADSAKAEAILTSKGYTKGSDGFWQKDGKHLGLTMGAPQYPDSLALTQTIVELLQQFGIDAVGKNVANDQWWDNANRANYDIQLGITGCGSVNEPYTFMSKYVGAGNSAKVGDVGIPERWTGPAADQFAQIVAQMAPLSVDDPKINELWVKGMTIWLQEAVTVPVAQNTGRVWVYDQTYWKNWPTADNPYIQGTFWWGSTMEIWPMLQPVTK